MADRHTVALGVAAGAARGAWWPDVRLHAVDDAHGAVLRWRVEGALRGTAELRLEGFNDGVVVHLHLRATCAVPRRRLPRGRERVEAEERRRRSVAWKRFVHVLKDVLEAGRAPGTPARTAGAVTARRRGRTAVPNR